MLCTIIIIIYTDYGTVSANISYLLHQIFLCMYVVISFHVFTDTKHLLEIYILRMNVGFKYTHAYFVPKWEIIIFMRLSFYLEQNFSAVTETPRTIWTLQYSTRICENDSTLTYSSTAAL